MWREMYLLLFRAVTKALVQMREQNYGLAAETLKKAQREAEAYYMESDE